ncbi:iron complex transport system permease protein [Actinobaculum suis]|uniref:Iron chelate uptake ABC transporter family permease subunit n=1 Tax=Actinobaculum suis TaxID=1657 RepID=A0A1G7CZJ8_9ACTO|nr:iron chelate uptake ABC transporter family permease subunit [Actinobaculum suis]MDY5152798.1 iron chelate uptake ABC transporter family permease subunit [Actinobaculum suis]SDE44762.1 iron complex transport system permease protein [Actinobaculum suis]
MKKYDDAAPATTSTTAAKANPPAPTQKTAAAAQNPAATQAPAPARPRRGTATFASRRARIIYWTILVAMIIAGLVFSVLHVTIGNIAEPGTQAWTIIANRRAKTLVVMLLVAVCQGMSTLAFQTVTNNRILTPAIMGFESLYSALQASVIFIFGVAGFVAFQGTGAFLAQVALMVALAVALYSWLLGGRMGNLHIMLLVGIIIGTGLRSLSTFIQRLLSPSEFDVLSARMFGSIANAKTDELPAAIGLATVAAILLFVYARRLNTVSLGRDVAINLGVNHTRALMWTLTLVAMLVSVSMALVGPMTFFGFLAATLTYQAAETYDHRFLFPMVVAIGYTLLVGAYVIMQNVFYAEGVVSIIIELVGGTFFLIVVLKRGRL